MVLYNALPKKEYERIFMCKTAKDIWQSLLITHQGNSQVKYKKIYLLVQQYEQFTILEEESIDNDFSRFNTIITSLKALDEGFSSKNYVRKFLRALHPKWTAKVAAIEESKDLSSLALDELISNQEKKRSHSDKEMRRKERVTGNVLDALIQIISMAIVQNHLATKIKRPLLEVLGAIAKMTPKTKPTMKRVSWLNPRIRSDFVITGKKLIHNSIDESKKPYLKPSPKSGNRDSLRDKNEAKTDKTENGNGKCVKSQSQRHVHLKWANPYPS
ncbi:hypothetical protein Tco_0093732 [Tanacetum coccineum]